MKYSFEFRMRKIEVSVIAQDMPKALLEANRVCPNHQFTHDDCIAVFPYIPKKEDNGS